MEISCDIIKDLLPLYVDHLTSEDSNRLIKEHVKTCKVCKDTLDTLRSDMELAEVSTGLPDKSSEKLFKRVRNRLMAFSAFILLAGIVIAFFGGNIGTRYSAHTSANKFFKNVIESQYEEAFKYVHYYDGPSDHTPAISYNTAMEAWVHRMRALKEKGTYIKGYNGLQIRVDDTYPQGRVNLVIVENGKEITRTESIWFSRSSGKWKVGNIYEDAEQTELEQAVSGHITAKEGDRNVD